MTVAGGSIIGDKSNCSADDAGIRAAGTAVVTVTSAGAEIRDVSPALVLERAAKGRISKTTITRTTPAGCLPAPSVTGAGPSRS